MKFGTSIMGISLRSFPEVAQAFEQNGLESIWIPEHLVFPAVMPPTYPYSDSGLPPVTPDTPAYDPWAVLSFLACATQTIRLATNVYILPLRHPLQTARSVVTVDRLSGGRVTLGMGVGWMQDEFAYLRVPFKTRGKASDATIEILRRLWSEDVVEVHDDYFDFGPVKFQPKPLQRPSIPIEVGGAAPGALKRAGRIGDGWIEIGATDLADFTAKLEVVLAARRESGRDGPFEVTASGALASGLDGYRRLRDLGATRVLVYPGRPADGRPRPEDWIDWSKRFADEVIAKFDDR
ncbi:MAG TPA: LLM class F420-dependent oxidoreductase [Acidimicrobiales bacterium]|nr:LLM class F420-dependent oxidoreductase [Acidimicrobiales bacterium]